MSTLRNQNKRSESDLKTLDLLLTIFEMMLSYANRLHSIHELSRDSMKEIESKLQNVYGELEIETYKTGLNLRDPDYSEHPLKLLWNRWNKCKKQVDEMIDWFMQK